MYPISQAFTNAIRTGYVIAARVDILTDDGVLLGTAPLVDGTVNEDRTATTRRTASLTIAGNPDIVPLFNTSVLTPFGHVVAPYFGFHNPTTGAIEWVPCGVLPMVTVNITDTPSDIQISVSASDRSWVVSQRKLTAPYTIAAGTDLAVAIESLISSVYPPARFNITPTTTVQSGGITVLTVTNFKAGDDPWAAAQTLADAGGYELFADRYGVFVARPIPNPAGTPVSWAYDATAGNSGPQSLQRTWTRQGVANDFRVVGAGTASSKTGPVVGAAADNNPNSPTYVSGPYGDIPSFVTSSLVTTTAQAQTAAANLLAASAGSTEQLSLNVSPNPAHDADDVIFVNRPRVGVTGNYVLDKVSISLRHSGSGQLSCRSVVG